MSTTKELTELLEKASKGPIFVLDLRPEREALTLANSENVVCRIENSVARRPLGQDDIANAELIAYAFNNAESFRDLLVTAEQVNRLTDELLTAVECAEDDVGGSRPTAEILGELGPAQEELSETLAKFKEKS